MRERFAGDELEKLTIKVGSYGEVRLIRGSIESKGPIEAQLSFRDLMAHLARLARVSPAKRARVNMIKHDSVRAAGIVEVGVVGLDDLRDLPNLKRENVRDKRPKLHLAGSLAGIHLHYIRQYGNTAGLGCILADYFEVLPTDISAGLVLGAADPEVSLDVFDGFSYNTHHVGINTQSDVVTGVSLLPSGARIGLWRNMMQVDGHGAKGLLNLIAANFARRDSPYCAPILIKAELSGDRMVGAIDSLRTDLSTLRVIVNSGL